ncbi:MAG: hypothetical protein Q8L55_03320 [Phycisphaerales bacterium]|nr:hypothetical protein [Phycisphaerales bacterium]
MKTSMITLAALLMTLTLGACGSTAVSGSQSLRVDTAVKIAKAVEANPDRAGAVLRENGMTADAYEDLMYDIAADPAMSAEFNSRMGG